MKKKHIYNFYLSGGGGYSAAVTLALNNITGRGGVLPTGSVLDAYIAFIDGIVTLGIYNDILGAYIFKGTNDITCMTNLIQNDFHGSKVNTVTFSINGMTTTSPAAIHYLALDLNPTNDGGSIYTQNDAMTAVGLTHNSSTDYLKSPNSTPLLVNNAFPSGNMFIQWQINDGSARNSNTGVAAINGSIITDRNASGDSKLYYNGAQVGTSTQASTAIPNSTVNLSCVSTGGDDYLKCFIIGGSQRSNIAGISTLITNLMAAY